MDADEVGGLQSRFGLLPESGVVLPPTAVVAVLVGGVWSGGEARETNLNAGEPLFEPPLAFNEELGEFVAVGPRAVDAVSA